MCIYLYFDDILMKSNLYRSTCPSVFSSSKFGLGTGFSAGFRTLPKTLARIKFTAQATSDLGHRRGSTRLVLMGNMGETR